MMKSFVPLTSNLLQYININEDLILISISNYLNYNIEKQN